MLRVGSRFVRQPLAVAGCSLQQQRIMMFRTSADGKRRIYNRQEVASHNTEDSLWVT